jgi:uncharacterized membrane protein
MVIGILAVILVLSGAISVGAVRPALDAFLWFGSLFLVYLLACMVPGYIKIRIAGATLGAAPQARRSAETTILPSKA